MNDTHMREHKNTDKITRRLKIIEGQVRGLQEMVARGEYCIDVITQTSAVKEALSGVEDALLEDHLKTCAAGQFRSGKGDTTTSEILKVYKLAKRRK